MQTNTKQPHLQIRFVINLRIFSAAGTAQSGGADELIELRRVAVDDRSVIIVEVSTRVHVAPGARTPLISLAPVAAIDTSVHRRKLG